ncbi:MAG: carboxypeptidase M32 [Sumerlaeia bacterium]
MSAQTEYNELLAKLAEVNDLHKAAALLSWDQQTYMPPKGAKARGEQLATLSALAHRLFTKSQVGDTLQRLAEASAELSPDENKTVELTQWHYDRATRLPEAFVKECSETEAQAFEAWTVAKKNADFKTFQPHLEKLISQARRRADYYGYEGSPYNALLESFERGMTAEKIQPLFAEMAARLSDLTARILASPNQPKTDWLDDTEWAVDRQWDFSILILREMGYDFDAGRQDKSAHPFTTNFDLHDVRVTTRLHPKMLFSGFRSSVHEGGHALYEQGFLDADRRTPLAEAISLGIHESQSRMWENMIGCSRAFWTNYFPRLREHFPQELNDVTLDELVRAVNKVDRTLIRVEADEVTYGIHIVIRFEIELALLEGELEAADIPAAWNAKIKEYLGLDVPDDGVGCLQDVHWSYGAFGYFPTYALGNLYAAQMMPRIEKDLPQLWEQVGRGELLPLREWLRKNVHEVGSRKTAPELIASLTGRGLEAEPFLAYLEKKYGELYRL